MCIRDSAIALRSFPNLNASYTDEGIVQHGAINVASAVALESGLITPVVSNADQRSLGSLAREAKRLVAAARDGKLGPNDMQGGTFTVSNLGMYGILEFTSIVNPPQAAILSVGATERIPVFKDDSDEIIARHSMHLTIGADHRATDGAEAARFLLEIKRLLENPMQPVSYTHLDVYKRQHRAYSVGVFCIRQPKERFLEDYCLPDSSIRFAGKHDAKGYIFLPFCVSPIATERDRHMPVITVREALRQALHDIMKDERVFIIGEDIGHYGSTYGITAGFLAVSYTHLDVYKRQG